MEPMPSFSAGGAAALAAMRHGIVTEPADTGEVATGANAIVAVCYRDRDGAQTLDLQLGADGDNTNFSNSQRPQTAASERHMLWHPALPLEKTEAEMHAMFPSVLQEIEIGKWMVSGNIEARFPRLQACMRRMHHSRERVPCAHIRVWMSRASMHECTRFVTPMRCKCVPCGKPTCFL